MSNGEKFLVEVKNVTFAPDLSAIREFGSQLKAKLDADPAFKKKFDDDPRSVLNDAGVAIDLQREILEGAGLGGIEAAEADCSFTCFITSCQLGSIL